MKVLSSCDDNKHYTITTNGIISFEDNKYYV